MPDTATFSALIDECAATLARGLNSVTRAQLIGYARSTLKECHTLAYFKKDFTEDQITVTASPHIWNHPLDLRKLLVVEYPYGIYPKFVNPGRRKDDFDFYYYRASTYFVFASVAINDIIKLGYYSKGRKFAYYADGVRPAFYDDVEEIWQYLDTNGEYQDTLGSISLDETAQAKVTDWLLLQWYETIVEGTLAKVLKSYGDKRAASTFAVFRDMKNSLVSDEAFEAMEI